MANELVIPPDILPESPVGITLVDDQTFPFTPQFGRSWTQRNSYGDPRWQFKHKYKGLRRQDSARMHAVVSEVQGGYRTIMVSPGQLIRGTWAAQAGGELLTNADFSNGITGHNTSTGVLISTSDQVARVKAPGYAVTFDMYQSLTVTANVPYVMRGVYYDTGNSVGNLGPVLSDATVSADGRSTSRGYRTCALVIDGTAMTAFELYWTGGTSNYIAGAFVEVPFVSCSRCFLVDGGGNLMQRSDELDNAVYTKTATTVSANSVTAPDGSVTGDALFETAVTSQHYAFQPISVSSAALDYTFSVCLRSNGRNFAYLEIDENTGSTAAIQYFNLGTGAVGASGSTGGNWSNRRSSIVSMGNSWYMCTLTATKTNAATTLQFVIGVASADGTSSYLGNGNGISVWRATATQSSVPSMLTQSVASAVATTPRSGYSIPVKGLPASQAGLLVKGDWVEIDGQLKRLTASLDSDASGLGTLQFRPKIYRAVADSTPVIVTKPLGRFMMQGNVELDSMYGLNSDYTLTLDEVYE